MTLAAYHAPEFPSVVTFAAASGARMYGEITRDGHELILFLVEPGMPPGSWAGNFTPLARWCSGQLQRTPPLWKVTNPPGGAKTPLTWATVVIAANAFGPLWTPGPGLMAWLAEESKRRTAVAEPLTVTMPSGLELRGYQEVGAWHIATMGRFLLNDDPGTGKTITTIVGLRERIAKYGREAVLPALVVCPNGVIDQWVDAFRVWAPELSAVAYVGTPTQRARLIGRYDVLVSSYGTVSRDAEPRPAGPLYRLHPVTVVPDEYHLTKNPNAKRSVAVRRLARKALTLVAPSGTPISHSPRDHWPILEALDPAAQPSRDRWVPWFCSIVDGEFGDKVLGLKPTREHVYRTALLGQQRRMAKEDVLTELPPKVYTVRKVHMPPAWKKAYKDFAEHMIAELPDNDDKLSTMESIVKLTRLIQLASAPCDIEVEKEEQEDGTFKERTHVTLKAPSWKVAELLDILAERPNRQTVVFTMHRQLIELAMTEVAEAGYTTGLIVGGQKKAERTAIREAFQRGEVSVLGVTAQAGGTGLNLTAGSTVAFLQRPWSLIDSIQAEDRCHRIGSEAHESIEIIDIQTVGTVDTRIMSTLHDKTQQLADLLQDPRIMRELITPGA